MEAKKRIEEENKNREEHQSILNTAKKIRILGKDGYFFSRKQLESYKKYYKVKKWDQFDKLYDASVTFWKNFEDNLKLLCLPTCISIEDYAKFVEQMDVMKNNIDKINNQYRQNIRSIVSTYDACD